MEKYFSDQKNTAYGKKYGHFLPIMTTRGCPNNCSFCGTPAMWKRRYRMRSIENVLEEIQKIVNKYHLQHIQIIDDNFLANKKRAKELLKKFILRFKGITIDFANHLEIDLLDEEIIELASQICKELSFGVEFGSQRILDLVRKPLNLSQHLSIFQKIKDTGLELHTHFIIGFPEETEEDLMQTYRVGKMLKEKYDAYVEFYIFCPLPGTEIFEKLDFELNDALLDFSFSSGPGKSVNKNISIERLREARKQFWQEINFNTHKKNKDEKMELKIDGKTIGENSPAFIIAELSANHNQDFDLAMKTIKAAKDAGADAIKFQTYTPDTLTIDSDKEFFKIGAGSLWEGETLYSLFQKAHTPWEWQPKLKEYAESIGLICFSSPFDKTAVDFLEKMNVPAYKVASLEITDLPLIEYIASKGKPVIISTGAATMEDIKEAVNACKKMGNEQIAVLKCVSTYPTSLEEINLKVIPDLSQRFKVVSGLSDHSLGISVPIASISLGAKIIEKHFIIDKKIPSSDVAFSLDFEEFKAMVKSVREVEKALGTVTYELTEKIKKERCFLRSLFITKDVKEGEVLTEENVRSIRPGQGLHPKHLPKVLGKKFTQDSTKGTPLSWDLID
jgi:pseudaminic acid synthase